MVTFHTTPRYTPSEIGRAVKRNLKRSKKENIK